MSILKTIFKCTGCGEDRPCYLETNQEPSPPYIGLLTEDLKCVLDPTNQTSYNWEKVEVESDQFNESINLIKGKLTAIEHNRFPNVISESINELLGHLDALKSLFKIISK